MEKPKTIRPVRPNASIQAKYRKELAASISAMIKSVEYWLSAAYKKRPPLASDLAMDASPSLFILGVIKELRKRWIKNFNNNANDIANKYISGQSKATDSAFSQALKDAGWTVEFKMTRAMQDALSAMISENVGLIKSIPEQYFSKIEGIVMRGYSRGHDLHSIVTELRDLSPITKNRAILIARDQVSKANAITNRARSLELGIEEAVWVHSSAGKYPREDHIKANGKKYNVAEGCKISGEFIHPGELINCRCFSRMVLPF